MDDLSKSNAVLPGDRGESLEDTADPKPGDNKGKSKFDEGLPPVSKRCGDVGEVAEFIWLFV